MAERYVNYTLTHPLQPISEELPDTTRNAEYHHLLYICICAAAYAVCIFAYFGLFSVYKARISRFF